MVQKTEAEQALSTLSGWWEAYSVLVQRGVIPVNDERERLNRVYDHHSALIQKAADGVFREGSPKYIEALVFANSIINELAHAVEIAAKSTKKS